MLHLLRLVCLFTVLASSSLHASTLYLGFLSYDNLIPGDGAPGVNVFTLANLTGDPGDSGFSLPPDFPVFTAATFQNASLTLFDDLGNALTPISLGSVAPGFFDPTGILEFPDTALFSRAEFSATLSATSLLLFDATTAGPFSPNITVTLLPTTGQFLAPGIDLVLIDAQPISDVPEPGTLLLSGLGLLSIVARSRWRDLRLSVEL